MLSECVNAFNSFRIDLDVTILGVFVAFHDVCLLDLTSFVDISMVDPLMGFAIDLMELHRAARIRGWEDLYCDRDQGNLYRTGPCGACWHRFSFSLQIPSKDTMEIQIVSF
jgi:hypothetical protein